MEIAKLSPQGQVTIPAAIRKRLGLKNGDRIVFAEENGRIVIENAALLALRKVQDDFTGEAERSGMVTKQDVVRMIDKA
jgi:AbrB family looped-hinge helix DNA binding protein